MKILFSNPPWWIADEGQPLRIGIRAGSRWPFTRASVHRPDEFRFGGYLPFPFFMASAAAYARREIPGSVVEMRDSIARGESYEMFFQHLADTLPDWLVIESATPCWEHDQKLIAEIGLRWPEMRVIVCGTIVAGCEFKKPAGVFAACKGEYEKGVVELITSGRTQPSGVLDFSLLTTAEMNALPFPLFDESCALHYADGCPKGQHFPQLQVWSSRGCGYKCLSGDTVVNTTEGKIPIRDLVGREDIGVFTYDPVERRAKVCTAKNIRSYGNDSLVRVKFDDGSHIDCTPDHRFMAFKWGNQFTGEKEWTAEAKDLVAGTHVRAIRFIPSGAYIDAAWSRRGREKAHRMVAEWKIGRRLTRSEKVHHEDRNKLNFHHDNLTVCADAKAHFAMHPEISERMRVDNPAKNGLTKEWAEKIAKSNTGKIRTPESRERYRQAAIIREAKKTAEQKRIDAERMHAAYQQKRPWENRARAIDGRFEPADILNHRIVAVEKLDGVHEVYCLEIPETGWFYANNVLVKNCVFCSWPGTMTGNDPDGTKPRKVRGHSAEWFEAMLRERLAIAAAAGQPYRCIYLDDDTFNLTAKHTREICAVMKRIGLPWSAMCRADTIGTEDWHAMKDAGCFGVKLGFESGSQRVIDEIVNKRLDLKAAAETARFLRSIGMTVHGTFTVGLPGETAAEQQQTRDFIHQLYASGAIDTHQLSGTAVIEGSPLGNIVAKKIKLAKYPGATPSGYVAERDGQRKIEHMGK